MSVGVHGTQKVPTWIQCHINAFNFFGGVAKSVKLDNLKSGVIDANFYEQINTNNMQMLEAFEALQDNVVLLKSDMMSALSINIAFESNDGD